jgi:hypothetical protein
MVSNQGSTFHKPSPVDRFFIFSHDWCSSLPKIPSSVSFICLYFPAFSPTGWLQRWIRGE